MNRGALGIFKDSALLALRKPSPKRHKVLQVVAPVSPDLVRVIVDGLNLFDDHACAVDGIVFLKSTSEIATAYLVEIYYRHTALESKALPQ